MPEIVDRVDTLQRRLEEQGLVSDQEIDDVIDLYSDKLTPQHGSRIVAMAWTDPELKQRLLYDAGDVVRSLGYDLGGSHHPGLEEFDLRVVENTPEVHNVIVCTLCSCYPLSLLGVQPRWYKSPSYRARVVVEPRAVLQEFGLSLPEDVRIDVWDSTAETRYMVLPMRPEGTEGWSIPRLMDCVTRDSLVGVTVPRAH